MLEAKSWLKFNLFSLFFTKNSGTFKKNFLVKIIVYSLYNPKNCLLLQLIHFKSFLKMIFVHKAQKRLWRRQTVTWISRMFARLGHNRRTLVSENVFVRVAGRFFVVFRVDLFDIFIVFSFKHRIRLCEIIVKKVSIFIQSENAVPKFSIENSLRRKP